MSQLAIPTFGNLCALGALVTLSACASGLVDVREPVVLSPIAQTKIIDGRDHFRSLFCAQLEATYQPCDQWLQRVGAEPRLARATVEPATTKPRLYLVPGIFGECVSEKVTLFGDALPGLESDGYTTKIIEVKGRASSNYNAQIIRDFLVSDLPANEKAILVGYSKGATDALTALTKYPELHARIAGLISVAGVSVAVSMAPNRN